MHHASIRTADIYQAIAFYELLGFEVVRTLYCWHYLGLLDGRFKWANRTDAGART